MCKLNDNLFQKYLDFRNILCLTSKNMLSKVILKDHVSMLICPSCVSQNQFQNKKSFESSITSYTSIGNFKNTYPLIFTISTDHLLWTLSLLHIRTMNILISLYVLALQRLLHFIACVVSISLFFSYFFVGSTTC